MGIDSYIWVGYGFIIPEHEFDHLLQWDREIDYYDGDNDYTHQIIGDIFVYGKVVYHTEARVYLWDGNKEIVDLKKALKIHHMQRMKIDKTAKQCGTKASYFAVSSVS